MDRRDENLSKIREMGKSIAAGSSNLGQLDIDYTGFDGRHYEGEIIVKRPNMGDYIKMGVEKAKYIQKQIGVDASGRAIDLDVQYIDSTVSFLAHMLATFKVVVKKCPEWFLYPEEIEDFDFLNYIFTKYEVWLNSFRSGSSEKPQGNS
jgi:hypothetical protein